MSDSRPIPSTWKRALTLAVPLLFFLVFCVYFFEFVLDDAYITLRYSKHVAEGQGPLWNTGATGQPWGGPVEGYTSTLWMLVGVIPHMLGIDPVLALKFVAVLSTAGTLGTVFWFGRRVGVSNIILAPVCATIGLSPAVALITVQGMETALAMLLVSVAAVASVVLAESYDRRWAITLQVVLFLGMLTRPGLVVFGAGLLGTLFGLYVYEGRRRDATELFVSGVVLVFVPGLVFMLSRYAYFGYPFPNSFYAKESSQLLITRGAVNVAEFLTVVCGPALLIGLVVALSRPVSELRRSVRALAPLLVATGAFLSLWFFIRPIQGYLWRFQMPVLGAVLVAVVFLTRQYRLDVSGDTVFRGAVILFLLTGAFFPLHTFDDAVVEAETRDQTDRVIAGQALGDVDSDYRLFITESGAVPYYSGWTTIDKLGLNSEQIAHDGLDPELLAEYDPDVVMLLVGPQPGMIRSRSPPTAAYLNDSDYRLVAAVEKAGSRRSQYHLYFVDRESPGYREISCTLLQMDGVEYTRRDYFVVGSDINVTASALDRQDCT